MQSQIPAGSRPPSRSHARCAATAPVDPCSAKLRLPPSSSSLVGSPRASMARMASSLVVRPFDQAGMTNAAVASAGAPGASPSHCCGGSIASKAALTASSTEGTSISTLRAASATVRNFAIAACPTGASSSAQSHTNSRHLDRTALSTAGRGGGGGCAGSAAGCAGGRSFGRAAVATAGALGARSPALAIRCHLSTCICSC
eukprot:6335029-Prymnesium_polylepis.2